MTKPPLDAKALAFVVIVLLVVVTVLSRRRRRTVSDHDVSDPGVTL
jgi:hypothetical protein